MPRIKKPPGATTKVGFVIRIKRTAQQPLVRFSRGLLVPVLLEECDREVDHPSRPRFPHAVQLSHLPGSPTTRTQPEAKKKLGAGQGRAPAAPV